MRILWLPSIRLAEEREGCLEKRGFVSVLLVRFRRLNVVAGATDASRAMLFTSCRKVELLTAIFGFL